MSPHPVWTAEVDAGGTWARLILRRLRPKRSYAIRKRSVRVAGLAKWLRSELKKKGISRLADLRVGSRGVWSTKERQDLRRRFSPLAENVRVSSDVELAFERVFGKSPGILILAGTGSIALGINRSGQVARAGGLGPWKGDEGSGYWIGKNYLQRQGKDPQGRPVRSVAALARIVLRKAQRNDRAARALVEGSHDHLLDLLRAVARNLDWRGPFRLATSGGLFENGSFRSGFLRRLRMEFPDARLVSSRRPPPGGRPRAPRF